MNKARLWGVLAMSMALVTGCTRDPADAGTRTGLLQTRLPGHVAAGGGTSGTVMANRAVAPSQDMGAASRQGGTPGIPQGAGGNTSGTEMGGTTGTSALANTGEQTGTQNTPGQAAPAHAADASPAAARTGPAPPVPAAAAAADAAADDAKKERLLDERMTQVAQRWKQRSPSLPSGAPTATPPAVRDGASR